MALLRICGTRQGFRAEIFDDAGSGQHAGLIEDSRRLIESIERESFVIVRFDDDYDTGTRLRCRSGLYGEIGHRSQQDMLQFREELLLCLVGETVEARCLSWAELVSATSPSSLMLPTW